MKSKYHIQQTGAIRVGLFLTILALALAFAVPAQAATVPFTDDFSSGTANANDWYFWNSSSAGTAWATASAPSGTSLLGGNTLRNPGGSASNTAAIKSFTAVTLRNVNDSISVSLDIRSQGSNAGKQLQIGIYNLETPFAANSFGGTDPVSGKTGYTYGQYFAGGSQAAYALRSGSSATDSHTTATISGAASTDSVDHHIVFTLTLTEAGLRLSTVFGGTPMSSYTLSSVTGSVTVDTLRLFTGGITSQVYFDNIQVTTNVIPEPRQAGLLASGLAAVAILARRLRRRPDSTLHSHS
ncbi:MAG: hypothetical protein LBK99_03155 [Opitutaceae bacterium]|jgi:hypothetical protein|nr:hypothetical protein [Opitutaceae bacterium]